MDENKPQGGTGRITRRTFLKLAGVVLVSTSIATVAESCSPSAARQRPTTAQLAPPEIPVTGYLEKNYPDVPMTPDHLPSVRVLQFFTEAEAKLVDAIAGRIIPGTPDDPGAREADVFLYIDHKLAYPKNHGFVEPTYFRAPFAKLYEGDVPPPSSPESPKEIWVSAAQIDRYGFQGGMTPQDTYRRGLLSVDKYAQEKFQKKFVDLSEAQQDQILEDMDNGDAKGFDKPTDRVFFKTLRDDVIEGMFSDPVYGGNKDMVGWSLIGYPGAQRAYTPDDLHTEGNVRSPQSIAQLHMFHAGQPANPDVIVPPSGSEYEQQNNQK